MGQVAVEQTLGRLLTDAEFRDRFFANPTSCLGNEYSLSDAEREALIVSRSALSREVLARQADGLPSSIKRADLRVRE
jgi:hypothetical protein